MESRHKFEGLVPEMLVRRIRERRCVLFVGAGLSAQARTATGAPLPTWKGLLEGMIDWCVDHRVQLRAEPAELRDVLKRGRLLPVAQELQQSLGAQLNGCLSFVLHSGKTRPSEAHRLVCRTNWVAALTSNYDALIEGAYALESGGIVPPVFSPDGIHQALNCLRNDRFCVFKVHGDVNLQGSIVLGNRDYSKLLYLSPAYRSFLETVFATYTVLFVGFGGSDPELDGIIDRLSTIYERSIDQHFILISEDEFSALERRRLLEDKRLDCITYKRDASHTQVGEFLRAVAQRTTAEVEELSPFAGDQRQSRIFLSGSFRQIELLRQIGDVARRAGFDVWFSETQISAGDRIVDVIGKGIDDADCLVAVMTPDAAESSWVQFEIGRAWGAHKRILPIRVGEARVPSDLTGLQYLQIKGPQLTPEDEIRFAESLRRLLDRVKDS
jgi:hypothetical protein